MGLRVVGEAGTYAEGAAAAAELRPDAALVDVGLPDGDGLELAAHLVALPWRPRVVVASSDPDATSTEAVQRFGAIGFMAKEALAGRDADDDAHRRDSVGPCLRPCASWSARTTSCCARAWCGC